MGISTHILDTSKGKPAKGVRISLQKIEGTHVHEISTGVTDADGRIKALVAAGSTFDAGTYRLNFDVASYFEQNGTDAFYPSVSIDFVVKDPAEHFHVPLLLQPFGFATYRGS